jgi:iron-sulfur cluster repair protein YtfE (RIC family)
MSDDSIDLDEIIAIIAKKNKIIINERDPLLAVSTINDYVISHYFKKSKEALTELIGDIEKIHRLVSYQANQNANKIINASLKASQNLIEKNTKKSIEIINENIRKKIEERVKEEIEPIHNALKISNYMLLFSSLLLVSAAIIITIKF